MQRQKSQESSLLNHRNRFDDRSVFIQVLSLHASAVDVMRIILAIFLFELTLNMCCISQMSE